jgi:RIO-like serine/threonine protein kinase
MMGGPKKWMQRKMLPTQNVDPQNYSMLQLVDFIAEHYNWGSKQLITSWCDMETESVEINLMSSCLSGVNLI